MIEMEFVILDSEYVVHILLVKQNVPDCTFDVVNFLYVNIFDRKANLFRSELDSLVALVEGLILYPLELYSIIPS